MYRRRNRSVIMITIENIRTDLIPKRGQHPASGWPSKVKNHSKFVFIAFGCFNKLN